MTEIKSIKLFDIPEIKEELIILVDRENISIKELKDLLKLKGNYKILSFVSEIHKIKKIDNEELIKVKHIGKNSADFQILLYAQQLLLTTNKNVVIYTKDHYPECIENSNRYLYTNDVNLISLYFHHNKEISNNKKIQSETDNCLNLLADSDEESVDDLSSINTDDINEDDIDIVNAKKIMN